MREFTNLRERLPAIFKALAVGIPAGLPSNRLEALSGDRKGQYSIRINRQWRICFDWRANGPHNVEIVDYH